MQPFKTITSNTLAILQYAIGSGLFFSGVAGWHRNLHGFAMNQLQRASHKQHPKAQALMAKLLTYRGEGILDQRAGMALLHTRAQQGDVESQFLLAEALVKSDIIVANHPVSDALQWYIKAAEQHHTMAALRLSKAYQQGALGLEKNPQQAQYWSDQFFRHSQHTGAPL